MVATAGDKRKVIHIRYPCHVCGDKCKTATSVINHATIKHGQRLPSRPVGFNRPKNSSFRYENDIGQDWDEVHYGCPSCWFHSNDFEEFQAHIEENHYNVDKTKKSSNGKKSVNFVDDQPKNDDQIRTGPDLNKALDTVQQIVDLGNLLKGMLKI